MSGLPPTFTVRVHMLSDWIVGTGEGRVGEVDATVRRDGDGLPFVPAKTLTGIWRDACEQVAGWLGGRGRGQTTPGSRGWTGCSGRSRTGPATVPRGRTGRRSPRRWPCPRPGFLARCARRAGSPGVAGGGGPAPARGGDRLRDRRGPG